MTSAPGDGPIVLVGIPAHNEQDHIGPAVRAVLAAARYALRVGAVSGVDLVVVAHTCTDDTSSIARAVAASDTDERVGVAVLADDCSTTVGEVRGLAASAALESDVYAWVCTSDADSRVPLTWIVDLLEIADRSGADVVVPLVRLDGWLGSASALTTYEALVRDGLGEKAHDHVYGANLMIRALLYRRLGGFRPVPVAEDHDLVSRARGAGALVASPVTPVVTTSARYPGRATGGLGDLLARLDGAARTCDASPSGRNGALAADGTPSA